MRDIIINDILIPSLQRLYKVDYNNILFRVSERNICARLAYHLEVRMRRYDRQNQESRFAGNGLEEGRDFCMGLVHYVRLEVRDLSNMTVPPHEMEFVPLLNRKEKKK